MRADELDDKQVLDMICGPVHRFHGAWRDPQYRRAAYEARRDRFLQDFPDSGLPPPRVAEMYETDPEFHRAAVRYWRARVTGPDGVVLAKHARCAEELDALLEDPDASRAQQLWQRSVRGLF